MAALNAFLGLGRKETGTESRQEAIATVEVRCDSGLVWIGTRGSQEGVLGLGSTVEGERTSWCMCMWDVCEGNARDEG